MKPNINIRLQIKDTRIHWYIYINLVLLKLKWVKELYLFKEEIHFKVFVVILIENKN